MTTYHVLICNDPPTCATTSTIEVDSSVFFLNSIPFDHLYLYAAFAGSSIVFAFTIRLCLKMLLAHRNQ